MDMEYGQPKSSNKKGSSKKTNQETNNDDGWIDIPLEINPNQFNNSSMMMGEGMGRKQQGQGNGGYRQSKKSRIIERIKEKRRNKREILMKRKKERREDMEGEFQERGIDWKQALVAKATKAFEAEGQQLGFNLAKLFKEEKNKNIIFKIVSVMDTQDVIQYAQDAIERFAKGGVKSDQGQMSMGSIFIEMIKSDMMSGDNDLYQEVFEKNQMQRKSKSERKKEKRGQQLQTEKSKMMNAGKKSNDPFANVFSDLI